jgi:PAS domain S-box-containing protein
MVDLLASSSAMPVTRAVHGGRIQPNHVYVIPSSRLPVVRAGRLVLTPLPGARAGSTALDVALRSLAKDQGAYAVGIVLSGTGGHGAAGLKEVLIAGGLGLAQDPATAQYDQMPRNAAAAGVLPHHILAPERIAAVLLAHARHLVRGGGIRPASGSRFFHDAPALDALATEVLPGVVARANEEMQALNEELEISKISLQKRTAASEQVEAQLRAVLDATADAIVTIDAEGRIVTFNGSASRMFGYALHEVIGRDVGMLLPPELRSLQDDCLGRYRNSRRLPVIGTSREVVAYRRDGSRFPALLSVSETADGGLLVGCLRDITADKALQEEVLHIAALEQERIGQELHDGTQQELTGLGLLAQNLAEDLQESGAAHAELARRVAAGIAEANRHVRATARGLVPVPVDSETLPAALRELVRTTQESYKLSCRLDCPEPLKMPDSATATHLYRIAQEAVGNAARHSKADHVLIRLVKGGSRLRLEIHDNGIGIPVQPGANGGVGLRLMEHRCTVIGGRFTVEPRAGGGTVVACTMPYLGRS